MANLKLIKGGKTGEDPKAPDYVSVINMAIIIVVFMGCFWIMKLCFDTILDNPDSVIKAGNKMLTGVSIASLSFIGIALGKEMSDSSNKHTSRWGTAIFCWFFGLAIYGAYHMTFK